MSFVDNSNVSVTTNATALCTAKESRTSILIANNGSATLYIGTTSAVTTSTGTPVPEGQAHSDSGEHCYRGIWYGIVASATLDVRVEDQYLMKVGGVAF